MASDNTITALILRTSQSESDNNAHGFFRSTPRDSPANTADKPDTGLGLLGVLPREIRVLICDLIFQERTHPISFKDCDDPLRNFYSETRTTSLEVRLVSQRFKLEYDERDAYHLLKNSFRLCQDSSLDGLPGPIGNGHGRFLSIPTLAVRTTVLHLDLECCRPKEGPQGCLAPVDGRPEERRHFYCDTAALPLLEKVYVHVSCGAAQGAVDSPPAGDSPPPPPKIPMLAQMSTFQNTYIRDPSQDNSIQSGEHEPRGASSSQSGGFVVCRQTKAIWTHTNGWNNGEKLERVRKVEFRYNRGFGMLLFLTR
jgi:hypothetical protein